MRKAAFVSIAFGFAMGWAGLFPIACGSTTAHPPELDLSKEGGGPLPDATTNYADQGSGPDTSSPGLDVIIPDTAPPVDVGVFDGSEAGDGADTSVPPAASITMGDAGAVTSIHFGNGGFVNCGTQANSVVLSIANTGGGTLTWSAALSAGAAYYTLIPTSGSIGAGGTQNLQIIPNAIPATSAVTADLYSGILTIQTNATNNPTQIIPLHQTAQGAIINSTLGTAFGFGAVAVNQTATAQFSMTNTGNVDATLKLAVGSTKYGVEPPAGGSPQMTTSFVLSANGTGAPTLTFTPPAAPASPYTDTMVTTLVQPDGGTPVAVCGSLPPNVTITGSGSNTVTVVPTTLDFGTIDCSSSGTSIAPPQTTTITNNGIPVTYTTALAKGSNSPFVVSPPSGSIATSANQVLTVTPAAIPFPASTAANGYGDTLTITTDDGTTKTPHTVILTQTARGAILLFNPLSISLQGGGNLSQFTQFQVQNVGNYEATWQLGGGSATTVVSPNASASNCSQVTNVWSSNLAQGNLVGGTSLTGTLTVCPPPRTMYSDGASTSTQILGAITLTVEPNPDTKPTILCADKPPDLELSVLGQ
jgi:hypothetical protein